MALRPLLLQRMWRTASAATCRSRPITWAPACRCSVSSFIEVLRGCVLQPRSFASDVRSTSALPWDEHCDNATLLAMTYLPIPANRGRPATAPGRNASTLAFALPPAPVTSQATPTRSPRLTAPFMLLREEDMPRDPARPPGSMLLPS